MLILKNENIEWKDHQVCRIQIGFRHSDLTKPSGTHFIMGKNINLEMQDSSHFKSKKYSLMSLTSAYRIISCDELLMIDCMGYEGQNQWTEIEIDKPGRLSYIDGCSNTNAIAPLRNGDPCLNYLFLPEGINQTAHVHPTARIGMIASGEGKVVYWDKGKVNELSLKEGTKFILPRFMKHSFHTQDSHLSVLVFHPDSEGGPMDEVNPMYSRTYVKSLR